MATVEDLISAPFEVSARTTVTNASCAAAITGKTGFRTHISGVMISASAAPAAAVAATLSDGTTTFTFQIPASAFAPIIWNLRSLPFAAGATVTLTVPALGSGVICSVALLGFIRS